ncbi:Tubulin-specific chaperone E [Cytospora mali]|uniref:Tubulin-specific chaperone E n=1 Tax=Cytospora mali TaxID=578113 RepID=A0A194VEK9_CYTMA|nr:Tubulin-specific chaperone E [Valsa mali var. pyri (nom. inval.)]
MAQTAENWIGKRLSYNGALCTVRYIGEVSGTIGTWLGVEWDDQSRGKHDGSHKGTRYFECLSRSPTAASFVRPERRADKPTTFLEALQEKYAGEVTADQTPISSGPQIIISGKVAEEIGFDKIRKQQARLNELKIVILDGLRIDRASDPKVSDKSIKEICPKVVELNLSRNLFTRLEDVVEICLQLEALRGLRLNGNRFQSTTTYSTGEDYVPAFAGVRELALDEMLLDWQGICQIATGFRDLTALYASANQLSSLPVDQAGALPPTLTAVHMEFNEFTTMSSLAGLAALPSLKNLHLKANNISAITSDASQEIPVFSKTLSYLDISYNNVSTWSFIDALPDSFPGLTSLRLAHNPIYENPGLGLDTSDASTTTSGKASVTEEAYMLTIGRLACLTSLNFSAITPNDRTNAEMFYLSRIGRQLSSVPEEDADKVIAQHRRYAELCDLYGEPVVVRRKEVNPAFLDARLINVKFRSGLAVGQTTEDSVSRQAQIPKSLDIYAVKGIAGRLFGLHPLKMRLIWETGEWDPVAGFDDEAGDSDDDDDDDDDGETVEGHEAMDVVQPVQPDEDAQEKNNKAGRWIKREVELKGSPRKFGFCVDGLDVSIRVEPR